MHRLAGTGVAVAGIVAALALSGCGGDSDGDSAKGAGAPSASTAPTSPAVAPSTGGAVVPDSDFEGTWTGLTDGKPVTLTVMSGKAALVAEEHVCQGSVQDMGVPMLTLTCTDGNTDRSMGAIESHSAAKLVISWGAKKDSLTKAETDKLPEGLPSDLPALPEL